jgi:hypothetical protein
MPEEFSAKDFDFVRVRTLSSQHLMLPQRS